jgi:pimeloyl-ACP methyl ester carboxylesterase
VIALAALVALPPLLVGLLGLGPDPDRLPRVGRAVEIGGGMQLNVQDLGAGNPIVLVHGLPSTLNDWAATPPRLAALGHRVIAYDRVGYGHSSRADPDASDTYTYASSAGDLGALLDALELEQATLVGWSYGGGVVQLFAEAHPERVSRLVLLASVGPASLEEEDLLDRLSHTRLAVPLFQWLGSVPPLALAIARGSIAEAFSGVENMPRGFADRMVAELLRPGTLAAWVREQQRHDPSVFRPEAISIPTLVLNGTDDRSVPLAVGEDLARRLPNARLARIEGGSHMIPVTHAEEVSTSVHAWIGDAGTFGK